MNESLMQPVTLLDGWYNVMTGLGVSGLDKRINTNFKLASILDDQTLIDIYRADGLGRRIIEVPIGDMVRNWFRIEADTNNAVLEYLAKRSAKKHVKSGLRWGNLFGGAVVFMGIDDGQDADKPVKENQIQSIKFFEVYDKRQITWTPEDIYTDPKEAMYGQPKLYSITNATTGNLFRVHESRCLVFLGEELPPQEKQQRQGWGDSRLQALFTRLRGVCDSLEGIEGINIEFIVGIMKIANLQQLLASKEGEQLLRSRIQALDMVKHSMNTVVIDKNEEFERASSFGVSGLRELIDVLIDVLCGISGIPRVKLIGDQAKGLGGEAAGNVRMYYDEIASDQEDKLGPQLNRLVKYTMLAKDCLGKELENWKITFNKLWQPTEKEESEARLLNTKSDSLYMALGLPPEYVIASRFGGKSYSHDLLIPKDFIDKLRATSIEELAKRIPENVKAGLSGGQKDMLNNGTDPGGTSKDNPGR